MNSQITFTFNSPLESGIRSLGILTHAYPAMLDIQRLVIFDHFVVHTGDIGGPVSLHPKLPLRSTEILVRRNLVERGLMLMMSRNLIKQIIDVNGIFYQAGEFSETFLNSLSAPYLKSLRERSDWVVNNYSNTGDDVLMEIIAKNFGEWIEEFHSIQKSLGN
ncbi:ABC-three component system middle component 2 [Ferruginibacter sp. HRS2-29]|uniref:ABC-three component system middle component 2 n=1 Tax=Ferruginibacter sp. HRS2-29 TaxID=2487334 RepID=UPI0020CCD9FD|nr:ABC-three component system middle component 2 [Ferruginibacter sp. HRS2-29]MCP9749984.1 threonine transporter [Ferruginibacter sp. HRS2-29]